MDLCAWNLNAPSALDAALVFKLDKEMSTVMIVAWFPRMDGAAVKGGMKITYRAK